MILASLSYISKRQNGEYNTITIINICIFVQKGKFVVNVQLFVRFRLVCFVIVLEKEAWSVDD